jgi:hypothetical protein
VPLQLFAQRTVQINHAAEVFRSPPVKPNGHTRSLAGLLSQVLYAETLYTAGSKALEVYKFFCCFIVNHESRIPPQAEL